MRSVTELTEPLMSHTPGASLGAYETRQRTQLIVDGFSNLALLAILFSGVQAQFISDTSANNTNAAAVATNAVLFGGLILSVSSALLATLSGRWFSILREDDSEFLSSQWLAAESRQKPYPIVEYLKFQKDTWMNKLPAQFQQVYSHPLSPITDSDLIRDSGNGLGLGGVGSKETPSTLTSSPTQEVKNMVDMEAGRAKSHFHGGAHLNPRERDVQFVINMIDEEINDGPATIREKLVSKVLLCAVGVCCGAFALFCVGIVLLTWNTQPMSVALFTSVLLGLNLLLMPGFFLKHRHKRVISQLALGRAAW